MAFHLYIDIIYPKIYVEKKLCQQPIISCDTLSIDVLLVIRYLGEEEDCESSRESRSNALLAKLQEQVKAREQQSFSNTAEEDNDHHQSDKEQKKKRQETDGVQRKTKKSKNVKKTDLNDEAASSTKKKKKHKKQKTLSSENESVNTGNADLLLCLIVFKLGDLVDLVCLKHFGTF